MFFIEARSEKHFMLRIQKSHGGFRKLVLLPIGFTSSRLMVSVLVLLKHKL
jgi:hypothetical protein